MMESVTTTNIGDDEEVKYIQAIPNETEFLEWQSKRICENCKWWHADHFCFNKVIDNAMDRVGTNFWSHEDFGCNQWEKKG